MADGRQTVQEAIKKVTAQALSKNEKIFTKQIKNAAENFLTNIQYAENQYREIIAQQRCKNKIQKLYQTMKEENNFLQMVLSAQHIFQSELNEAMGKIVYLAYILPSGSINFYDQAAVGEIYKTATGNIGRGNINPSFLQKVTESNILENDVKQAINRSIENKHQVYESAIARYDWTSTWNHDEKRKKTVFWYDQAINYSQNYANKGPIAEGYASAIIDDDPSFNNSNLENSIQMLVNNYINVNSKGAAISQDIIAGNYQFAIKSGKFSTARVWQYIALAKNINKIEVNISLDKFEEILPKITQISKTANGILNEINKYAQREAKEEIGKFVSVT